MSSAARNPDDYCYRHPDRPSFVLCEKCGRTICLECQTHVNGMVLCPDDARRSNVTMLPANQRPPKPKRVRREQPRWLASVTDRVPVVSLTLMVLIVVIWLVDLIWSPGVIEEHLWMVAGSLSTGSANSPVFGPWTLVTSMISNNAGGDGFLNVVFSLFSLFVIGRILEPELGRTKFLAAYVLSGLGASVFALLFGGIVTSAGSAIFGLIAVYAVLMRRRGANMIWLYAVIALNIVSIALSSARAVIWQGAVGGLLIGVAVGFALLIEPSPQPNNRQRAILIVIGVALVVAAIVRSVV